MSLKQLSQYAAAHGRHGDTELLHVSKDELDALRGIGALHGARITTNPHTGLPEAFSFGSILKTIAPIAAGIGGSFVGMPWLGALAAGAMTAADTGDLGKGLAAGLGSYAMGGLGNAALGAGTQALASTAADAATQAGSQALTDAAAQGATQGITDAATQGAAQAAAQGTSQQVAPALTQAIQENAAQQAAAAAGTPVTDQAAQAAAQAAVPNANQAMADSLGKSFPSLSADQLAQVTSEGTPDLMAQRAAMLDRFGQANYNMDASGNITQNAPIGGSFNPSVTDKLGALGVNDYLKIAKDNPGAVLGAGMQVMNMVTPEQKMGKPDYGDLSNLSKAKVVPDYYVRNQKHFASGGLATLRPFACGGPVAFDQGGEVPGAMQPGMGNDMYPQASVQQQSPMYNNATQIPMERAVLHSGYEQMTDPNTGDQTFAAGGLAGLSQGRAIRGPGDGMSDDVAASIGGVEPARLADGEYVVPADAVSHLGNGSTEAGVKRLDDMMARIRKARTGNAKQGKQIKPERYMPA